MIDEASGNHFTQPSLVKRLNILRKTWCATCTPPLNALIPVTVAGAVSNLPALCNLTHEQKVEQFIQLVQDKDFPYLDLPSVLSELRVNLSNLALTDVLNSWKMLFYTRMDFKPQWIPSMHRWASERLSFSLRVIACIDFSHLFPYGLGDLTQERTKCVLAQEWITHLLQFKCPRFKGSSYTFFTTCRRDISSMPAIYTPSRTWGTWPKLNCSNTLMTTSSWSYLLAFQGQTVSMLCVHGIRMSPLSRQHPF